MVIKYHIPPNFRAGVLIKNIQMTNFSQYIEGKGEILCKNKN